MKEIRIENLCKTYDDRPILRDISLTVPEASRLCVCGPSGCGKTTLLRLLMRLEAPTSGVITNIPEKLSAVFQEDRLCESMTALGNVRLTADISSENCARILQKLGLGEALCRPVVKLSGGMKRRVAVARALAHTAPLIILDEPFAGLDESAIALVISVVKEYASERTIIYTAHEQTDCFGHQRYIPLPLGRRG